MADELLFIGAEPASGVEFIGFDSTPLAEPVSAEHVETTPRLPVPAKPRQRRAARPRKRTHPVRVTFDDDEFRKLNMQAGAQGMVLPDYVRRCALRDPRLRSRQAEPAASDLFVRNKMVEVTIVRLTAPLSADLERRINAYFAPASRFTEAPARERPRLPARPNVFVRLGHFVTDLVGARWAGHRATPPA